MLYFVVVLLLFFGYLIVTNITTTYYYIIYKIGHVCIVSYYFLVILLECPFRRERHDVTLMRLIAASS